MLRVAMLEKGTKANLGTNPKMHTILHPETRNNTNKYYFAKNQGLVQGKQT
jgi:hypothetical protein